MTERAYRDLVFSIQAMRRRVERDALALGGALGIAANLFPHQVANVARVLGDVEVRHLLADEVGLGKTVQALMVMNALRLERPELRVAILVPDTLMVQWRDEIRGRAHVAPEDDPLLTLNAEGQSNQRPTLLWPKRLEQTPRVAEFLGRFDLLIVDEMQLFTEELQRQIVIAAPSVPHLLLLTATPGLHERVKADRIFKMIEPERAALAEGAPVLDSLRAREERVSALLEREQWPDDEFGGPPPEHALERCAALAHSAVRRVIRTRRESWRRLMPLREPKISLVEPTDAESKRQALMWRYFRHLGGLSREFALPQLAQRVLRSPASLRQRVTYLKGHGHEREGILQEVQPLLSSEHGDSRFDELCEILSAIWSSEPSTRVLVCAGDNLTVDDLEARLPRLFNRMATTGAELRVATLRNQTSGPDGIVPDDDRIAEAVRSFREGESQVLVAAEVGSSGLNLQCTRHLVLYSIPWDPHEIEQWIGRIDRIGNTALTLEGDELSPVLVYVIAQRGLVDERVVDIMRATTILRRSISLDPTKVSEVALSIQEAALSDDHGAWPDLLERARALGAASEVEDLGLPLSVHLPWTKGQAVDLASEIYQAPPTSPALEEQGSGIRARETALRNWLNAMRDAKEYSIRELSAGVRSLGYENFLGGRRHVSQVARHPLDETLTADSLGVVYFSLRRAKLAQPPATYCKPKNSNPRPLYFLDHGSPLHENLVEVWLTSGGEATPRFTLPIPAKHAWSALRGCALHIRVGRLDPRALIDAPAPGDDRERLDVDADRRFLLQHVPASLILSGLSLQRSGVAKRLTADQLSGFLAPGHGDPLLGARVGPWRDTGWLPPSVQAKVEAECAASLKASAEAEWAPSAERVRRAVEERCYVLSADEGGPSVLMAAGSSRISRRQARLRSAASLSVDRALSVWRSVWCLLE